MIAGTYPQRQIMPAAPHKRHYLIWVLAATFLVVVAAIMAGAAYALRPQPETCTPPSCKIPPPKVNPLPAEALYRSSTYGFALAFPSDEAPSKETDSGIEWISGDQSEGMVMRGEDANGRSAQQLVDDMQQATFPGATPAYPPTGIPGADLGYTPGYGQVYDVFASGGQSEHARVVIMAAVKNGTGVVMVAEAPFQQTTQGNDGHPNPAQLNIVHFPFFHMATSTLIWRGDPPL